MASRAARGGAAALTVAVSGCAAGAPAHPVPNVILILADDVGYGDLGCYGATKVRTPNLDRLARDGRRFTSAYAPAAVCSPTRYGVLTGCYPWRGPLKRGVLQGESPLCIAPGTPTLPAMLKARGYATAAVGKWHLGLGEARTDFNGDIRPGPLEIGFDTFFGLPATGDRVPTVLIQDHRVLNLDPKDPIRVSYGKPIGDEPTGLERPDLLKQKADRQHAGTIVNGISRIGTMTGGKSARWVDEDLADTFTARAVSFIENNKARPFFLYLATHDIHVPRAPNSRFRGTSSAGIRGDAIHQLDWCVGQVMDALERNGLAQNTLLIFTSDNGGELNDGYDDGADRDMADASINGPLRGTKSSLWEGGSRVPFIARWPARIRPGTSSAVLSLVDIIATAATITGADAPTFASDSIDQLPALLGRKGPRKEVVYMSGNGALAIRVGDWKYIPDLSTAGGWRATPADRLTGPGLYNLKDDIGETNNLAAKHPERVKAMAAALGKAKG